MVPAQRLLQRLSVYGVRVQQPGGWTAVQLNILTEAVLSLSSAMGGGAAFLIHLGGVIVRQQQLRFGGVAGAHRVILNSGGFTRWTVTHELAHAWDAAQHWQISRFMQRRLGAGFAQPVRHWLHPQDPAGWYLPGQGPPPCGIDARFNRREDFAESVTAYIFPQEAASRASARGWPYQDPQRGYHYDHFRETPRGRFIAELLG